MPQNAIIVLMAVLYFYAVTLTICLCLVPHVKLAKTEVAQSNVSSIVKQDVFRLQIAVDDVETVQTFQSTHELSCIESCPVDVKPLLFLQMVE